MYLGEHTSFMNLGEDKSYLEKGGIWSCWLTRSTGGFQVDASGIWKKKEEEDKFRGSPHKSSVADGRKNKN